MADLIIIYWRDIPAQVLAKQGRTAAKRELSPRFQEAIDRTAMRAGGRDSDAYLADWRRADPIEAIGELEDIARDCAERLEKDYPQERLKSLVESGGRETPEHFVFFSPSGKRGRHAAGKDILSIARAEGVDLDSVCGGRGICGRCQVVIGEGEYAKLGVASAAAHVTPVNAVEARYVAKRGALGAGRRLGCQTFLCGDVVIDVPPDSQAHRQIVRKSADERAIEVDPVVHLHYVEVAQPDMHEPASDARRLQEALAAQWNLEAVNIPPALLPGLQAILRAGEWRVTAAIRNGRDLVALYPGLKERIVGAAVDIGSTTIAAHLCDLASGETLASSGVMNPQIRFGEDLMSRVSYAMLNAGGAAELTRVAREAVNGLIARAADEAKLSRDDIVEMVVVGNPIMHHLFLGVDPVELGGAPFALAVDGPVDVPARDVGVAIALGAFIHLLPCIAGHVGADASAVVLSEVPHKSEELTLIVDVGTNAEILLGDKRKVLACSSPTGPAFEGAQITSGQRAAPGAIERVRIDRDTLEPRYRIIGSDLWSDEPGFEDAARATGVTGICGSGIIEALAEMFLAGLIRSDGVIDGEMASRTPRVVAEDRTFSYLLRDGAKPIVITQQDVRAIQLAKAALYAGARLLMDRMGVDKVERIKLAGAFGSHIDPLHAMVLGLTPDCALDRVSAVGNAAGHGARIALLNAAARREIADAVRRIEKVETAIEPGFQAHFVAAMALPHGSDAFPHLAAAVRLPEATTPVRTRRRRAQ
ncbi:virulence factor [Terrarubrum flagellatum]|uniref:virulence factor n=1 Tax=Terrirubrum flagellatum TaxID=2895980 RepID=UPI0031453F7A